MIVNWKRAALKEDLEALLSNSGNKTQFYRSVLPLLMDSDKDINDKYKEIQTVLLKLQFKNLEEKKQVKR
jgi:hypothetical protein